MGTLPGAISQFSKPYRLWEAASTVPVTQLRGYSMRGGRMLTTDNYECTWDLYRTIPSLHQKGKSVFDETVEFNEQAQGAFDGEACGPTPGEGSRKVDGILDAPTGSNC
jgi:hypothetical protein